MGEEVPLVLAAGPEPGPAAPTGGPAQTSKGRRMRQARSSPCSPLLLAILRHHPAPPKLPPDTTHRRPVASGVESSWQLRLFGVRAARVTAPFVDGGSPRTPARCVPSHATHPALLPVSPYHGRHADHRSEER